MATSPLTIRELTTHAELAAAHAVMVQLRPYLPPGEGFVAMVRRQQPEGYALFGGFVDDRLVALAGTRPTHTLSRGPHLFVDDFVTAADARGAGHGTAMLRWLGRVARDRALPRICLNSRDTARTFYEQIGFSMSTAVPCCIETDDLLNANQS